jgi:aryl sulfotransferase
MRLTRDEFDNVTSLEGTEQGQPHRTVAWLTSYPRSGNTWVRAMLCCLLSPTVNPLEHMQLIIPDLYGRVRAGTLAARSPLIVKSHDPFEAAVSSLRRWELSADDHKIVLMVRDPADVAVSCFDFAVLNADDEQSSLLAGDRDQQLRMFINAFIENDGYVDYSRAAPVGLLEHTASWLAAMQRYGGVVVRFDDLLREPANALRRIASYLNIQADEDTVRLAVSACQFQTLRDVEERHIRENRETDSEFFRSWRRPGYDRGYRFFNQGTNGRGKEMLTDEERSQFRNRFALIYGTFGL